MLDIENMVWLSKQMNWTYVDPLQHVEIVKLVVLICKKGTSAQKKMVVH